MRLAFAGASAESGLLLFCERASLLSAGYAPPGDETGAAKKMEITLVRSSSQRKNPRLVVFNIQGRSGSVQFFRALFPNDDVPATLTLSGTFAEARATETPE